jgi:hypothetical protein
MSITFKKISDDQNDLGFEEIILLGCRISSVIHIPNTPIIENNKLICDDIEAYKVNYEWLAELDGQMQTIQECELFSSIHCYEKIEDDTIKPKQLVYNN